MQDRSATKEKLEFGWECEKTESASYLLKPRCSSARTLRASAAARHLVSSAGARGDFHMSNDCSERARAVRYFGAEWGNHRDDADCGCPRYNPTCTPALIYRSSELPFVCASQIFRTKKATCCGAYGLSLHSTRPSGSASKFIASWRWREL